MTPQRIAYVVSTFPKISETFIMGELAEVRRRGVDVRVLSLKRPEDALRHAGPDEATLLQRTTYGSSRFAPVLDEFRPQLFHAHFATEPTAFARALAAERGVPFTFTAHGYDVYRRPPADLAERAAAAASVITVSNANRRHISSTFRVPCDRIHVIPCGIDTTWFVPGTPDAQPPLVVCVARLREVKQLDLLMQACAIVRDRGTAFRCVILGEGPERPRLESLRAGLQLESCIDMPGAATQSEVRQWWQLAGVAVLSSRSEGMPVSLMEAAACGVPAVAPDVGGIPELIVHGETGLVTPAGDARAFADALDEMLGDERSRLEMGRAARRRAEACFSRTTQIDRLLAVWSSISN